MASRSKIPRSLTILQKQIHTSQPLPPPTQHLPTASTSTSTSTSPLSHLPPLLSAPPNRLPQTPTDTQSAINLIKSQSTPSTGIYLIARLHSRTYLLHPRDTLTLPTLKPILPPGTSMALTRIMEVGSRDYSITSPLSNGRQIRKNTLKEGGNVMELVDSLEGVPLDVASCSLTVIEHTKSPLTRTVLKKRRKGYRKTIENKQGWTRLRVGDIFVGGGPAGGQGGVEEATHASS